MYTPQPIPPQDAAPEIVLGQKFHLSEIYLGRNWRPRNYSVTVVKIEGDAAYLSIGKEGCVKINIKSPHWRAALDTRGKTFGIIWNSRRHYFNARKAQAIAGTVVEVLTKQGRSTPSLIAMEQVAKTLGIELT